MNLKTFAALAPMQRSFLAALAAGAQAVRRFGSYEAYQELNGKTVPTGVRLNQEQFTALVDAVPGLRIESNPGANQCSAFVWLPSMHRGEVADLLTQTISTKHLHIHREVAPAEAGGGVIEFSRQRA